MAVEASWRPLFSRLCSAGGHGACRAGSLLRGLGWLDGSHPSPAAGGSQKVGGWAVGRRSSRSRKGRWGRGPGGGEQEGRRLAPTPVPAPAGQSCHWVIWPPGAAGSSPHRAGIFHPFSLALIFFFNKNNYEGSKTPFFLDIPALRSQQRVGGKECPLSLRPLAFI